MGTALITGASAGLGKDFATLFATDGHDLVLVARREDRLEEIASELREKHGVNVIVHAADLGDRQAPTEIFDAIQTQGVVVEFLVNNAGFGSNGTFWELPLDRELGQIHVNIEALVHLTHLFVGPMVQRSSGRVLNIASTAGFQAGPNMATYYATKAFVISFTEAIAHELRGTGVRATAHCPGATATEFSAIAGNDKSNLFKKGNVATSMDVARDAYRAMHAGKPLAIHGAMNSFLAFGNRFAPRSMVTTITGKLNGT
jgi:short-subunit dehydrogenase